jgi:hypothetical protein
MNQLVPIAPQETRPVDLYRMSTDAAEVCKGIVTASATTIQGRKFVTVEGWQAIAIAHGCAAGARDVEKVDGGVRAIGEVRRMSDGQLIAQAEGFVGEDEPTWYGGQSRGRTLPRRNDYAIRAMAQTRAISRACRSAFAHVVVMMNAGLSTTPAEEVPEEGFERATAAPVTATETPPAETLITDDQYAMIDALLKATGVPLAKVLNAAKVKRLLDMSEEAATALIASLNGILAKRSATNQQAAPSANPQHDPVLADEVPY